MKKTKPLSKPKTSVCAKRKKASMSTGYSSGLRDQRVTILNRKEAVMGTYGIDSSGAGWTEAATVNAAVTWSKGMRTLNAGAVDAYGVVMVRMDWNDIINMRSRISWEGQTYQILPETFHAHKRNNTIQFNAQVIINKGTIDPKT